MKGKKERPSERKAMAARANARKPRGAWAGTPEREQLDSAKAEIRGALTLEGAARLAALIRDPETPAELFLAAFKLAGDRVGLPARQDVEIGGDAMPPVEVVFVHGGLNWPGVAEPGASAGHLDRARNQPPPGRLRPAVRDLGEGTSAVEPDLPVAGPTTREAQPVAKPTEAAGDALQAAPGAKEPRVVGGEGGVVLQEPGEAGRRRYFQKLDEDLFRDDGEDD